jgi:protein-L-isoaspartate O-methyltransferase
MLRKIYEKILYYAYKIFFEDLGSKFKPGTLRNFINLLYVIFEKTAYHFDFLASYYLEMYKDLVNDEIGLAKVSSDDQVLVVGCGSIPTTAMLIVMKTNAHVTSIDIDPKAIRNASILIDRLNLGRKLSLDCADGNNYPIRIFDSIFILYGVTEHEKMLRYIHNDMKKNTRIVFRSVIDENKEVLGLKNISKIFDVKKIITSKKLYPTTSCLLVKKY